MLTYVGSTGYGGQWLNTVLPKILLELQGLTISGPLAGAGANTAIAVTDGIDTQDTILKSLYFVAGSNPVDVTSSTSIVSLKATGTLTLSGVVAGDAVSVNGKVYSFVVGPQTPTSGNAPGQVYVGTSDTLTAAALANMIESQDLTLDASASTNVVTITAKAEGTAANSVALSVANSNSHVTASASTLAGGSTTNAIKVSSSTSSGSILLFWFKKSRNLLQA
jgi:phage tail sheath gpL-like